MTPNESLQREESKITRPEVPTSLKCSTKRSILVIGGVVGIPAVLILFRVGYYLFGYDGPKGALVAFGGEFVMDGDARSTIVPQDAIVHDPFFLAVWFGKVKKVLVVKGSQKGERAYVWKRALPSQWNEDFGWTTEVGIAAQGPHGCIEARDKCRLRNEKGDALLFLRAFTPSDGNQYWRMAVKPDMIHSTSEGIRDPVSVWEGRFISARDVMKVLEHYYQAVDIEYPD